MNKEFRVYFQGGYWRVDRLVKLFHFWHRWKRIYRDHRFYGISHFSSKEDALRYVQNILIKERKTRSEESKGAEIFSGEQILSMNIPEPVPPKRPTPPSAPPSRPVPPATRVVKEMW